MPRHKTGTGSNLNLQAGENGKMLLLLLVAMMVLRGMCINRNSFGLSVATCFYFRDGVFVTDECGFPN